MKKLSLKNLEIDNANVLQREQLKAITGGGYGLLTLDGDGGVMCSDVCQSNSDCSTGQECFTGTCAGDPTKMCRDKP